MQSDRSPGMLASIVDLVCRGWHVLAHVHTAYWLLFDVLRIAIPAIILTGAVGFFGEHSAAILAIILIIAVTGLGLIWIAGLGYADQRAASGTAPHRLAWLWNAPPDLQKLRTAWWLWLAIGTIGGIGIAQVRSIGTWEPFHVSLPSREITWDPLITFQIQRVENEYLIKTVEFHGKNTSGHGIYRIRSMIDSDGGMAVPLFILADGQWLDFDDIDVIPQNANFVVGCPMAKVKPNCGWETDGLTPDRFLKLLGAFSVNTFVEGRNISGLHFSIED
jgi:hypothetical protein